MPMTKLLTGSVSQVVSIAIAIAITIIMGGTAGLLGLLLKYMEYRSRNRMPPTLYSQY